MAKRELPGHAFRSMAARPACAVAMSLAALVGCVGWFPASLATDGADLVFNEPASAPVFPAAPGTPRFDRRAVFASIPNVNGSHAAAVTVLPDGELLAAWYSYTGPHELTGSAIYMARRPAGSDTWLAPYLHIDRPVGDGNPVLYTEGERVWLFQAVVPGLWSTARIEMQISSDRGRNWSEPALLPGPIGANVRFAPVRTARGDLLLPAYDDLLQRCLFYSSSDGLEWALLGAVSSNPPAIQPSVAVLPDGRVLSVMRNTQGGWLWVSASQDGGRTWTAPQDSRFPNPVSPAGLLQLRGGNLLLVYNDSPDERVNLTAALSADGGVTWPRRRVLVGSDERTSYPSLVEAPDRTIHLLFTVGRERIDHIAFNEAWVAQTLAGG